MSGQTGIRGYVYQGIVAIIKALNEKDWNKICVEYKSSLDKVDIAFSNDTTITNAIQVKSSINLFSKKEIIKWIDSLISDVEASHYELILIGNLEDEANIFIQGHDQLDSDKTKTGGRYGEIEKAYP